MEIPEFLIGFAGFVLAHAAWSVSDLPEGQLLVPLVVVENSGERKLLRFEAETQAEAIDNAKDYLAEQGSSLDAWVFAREGRVKIDGVYVDVLTVEARATGMEHSIIFLQKFQPYAAGEFKLLGVPLVALGGHIITDDKAEPILIQLQEGIQSHPEVAPLWDGWSEK